MSRMFFWMMITVLASACGRISQSSIKIIGGNPVAEHRPWFVQLLGSKNSADGFCGGTLVAPRVVITAAHCIDASMTKTLHVALGMADGINLNVNNPVRVEGIVVHPKYSASDFKNDIAVLYLENYDGIHFERPVHWIQHAKDSSLPERIHSSALVVGLGNTTSIGSLFDGVIREVEVPLADMSKCAEIYSDADEKQICAGDMTNGGRDSCQGDSGGPMLAKNSQGQLELVGIVSYGNGCAQKNGPGIYTRVASHLDFIEEAIADLSQSRDDDAVSAELVRLLKTRCTSQFGHIPFTKEASDASRRTTTYSIDLRTLDLMLSEKVPSGLKLDECDFVSEKTKIHAEWILPESASRTANKKVIVTVKVDGSETYISPPLKLAYKEDHLLCSTSAGHVSLADMRSVTYVTFKDVFYGLGQAADQPGDNQTTWGCAIDDASVEVYELPGSVGAGHELAARIHHKSVGTISVKLVRYDQELDISAKVTFDTVGKTKLTIENASTDDLFTWRMTCPAPFKITMQSGSEQSSVPNPTGSGFQVHIDAARNQDGTIRSKTLRAFDLDTETPEKLGECLINEFMPVLVSGAQKV